jgi:NDP-sugar pyrophosphorylase family protein
MIFAAGLGTRLGALGESTPKALLEIGGRTMLERTARSLAAAGARRIVVNVHHHADRIERFVAAHDLGAEVLVSHEPDGPLETGGGLLHARELFRGDNVLLLHNVDVICDVGLAALAAAQRSGEALATLAVNERETARYLLFDEDGLFGREDHRHGLRREVRPPRGAVRALAFAGIHACAPELPGLITERGAFPIVDV